MKNLFQYKRSRVFGREGNPLIVQRYGMQDVCPPHEHDFIEIVLAVGGSALQETARHSFPVKTGTLTVLRPGHWHSYLNTRRFFIYNCCFGPELLRRELSWLMDDPKLAWLLWGAGEGNKESEPQVFQLGPAAVKKLKVLLEDFPDGDGESYGVKVSRLALFLTALAEELPAPASGSQSRKMPAVSKSIRLIESDLSAEWTVGHLAKDCGCTPEYLIRLFKAAIGLTPHAYIDRCRAERAAALLLRSTSTVAEIGQQVGWPDPCHFARRFKQHYGISATKYREQLKTYV